MGGLDFTVETEDLTGNEDRTWIKTRKGFDTCRSIMLDVSSFLQAHVEDKGAIPSGIVLGEITATPGFYGPYEPAAVDGREVAAGFLFSTTKVGDGSGTDLATAPNVGVAMWWEGIVSRANLPLFTGTVLGELDAAAETDLANFVRFED